MQCQVVFEKSNLEEIHAYPKGETRRTDDPFA
jgi:hypothetical protein